MIDLLTFDLKNILEFITVKMSSLDEGNISIELKVFGVLQNAESQNLIE